MASPKSGIASASDLIARAKARAGCAELRVTRQRHAAPLAMELVKNQAGVFITHIPYRGTGPAVTDLLGGQIDVMFLPIHVALQHVKAGNLPARWRSAATSRTALLPDVPHAA